MRNSTRIYGAHFKGTNYNIKGYDKTYQTKAESNTKLSESLIRFELEANSRYFNNRKHPIGIYTVADLVNKSKFDALADDPATGKAVAFQTAMLSILEDPDAADVTLHPRYWAPFTLLGHSP